MRALIVARSSSTNSTISSSRVCEDPSYPSVCTSDFGGQISTQSPQCMQRPMSIL
jgi:hypothetical protein